MIVVVDDDAEHVHPYVSLTEKWALINLKKEITKMVGQKGEDNSGVTDFYERLETTATFDDVYKLVDGAHWGENDIKVIHVIDLTTATVVF
jgi:hypothetical protein